MNHTETFHLSHHDCDALSLALREKSTLAGSDNPGGRDAYEAAAKMLHEARMKAYDDRADRRRIKRQKQRESLDSCACHD